MVVFFSLKMVQIAFKPKTLSLFYEPAACLIVNHKPSLSYQQGTDNIQEITGHAYCQHFHRVLQCFQTASVHLCVIPYLAVCEGQITQEEMCTAQQETVKCIKIIVCVYNNSNDSHYIKDTQKNTNISCLCTLCPDVSTLQIIEQEINPHVDQWEAERQFPAHKIFKILGSAGFLGVNKPVGKSVYQPLSDQNSKQSAHIFS